MPNIRNCLLALMGLLMTSTGAEAATAKAVFAGGCFWCMESEFEKHKGIISAVSGYIGGEASDANYEAVSSKKTRHVEAVEITYDPKKTSYRQLLQIYWDNIDPTDAGGQMFDRGPQYATVIFYGSDEEKRAAEASRAEVEMKLDVPIATRIEALTPFYPAEEGHQNYYKTNAAHYNYYVEGSRRKERLKEVWGK